MNYLPRLPQLLRQSLQRARQLRQADDIEPLEKIDESLTPNMRALRLALAIAEKLLSMGVSARDVVHMANIITTTYCKRPASLDVSSTIITISQDRGNDREPLTLIRKIIPDSPNYQLIQALQQLALSVRDKHTPLEKAEQRLEHILSETHQHPDWLICTGGAILSSGVVLLYNGTLLMTGVGFLIGFFVTALLDSLARRGATTFFSRIIAALLITLTATLVAWANTALSLSVNPTLLIIGGIVLLVAGMMIVGAFQDAIDEYYVTANARILKVMMATSGIVIGVLCGLYVATRFGVSFPTTPDKLAMAKLQFQYIGAFLIAAGFALSNHARLFGMIVSGAVGIFAWWVMIYIESFGFGEVIASGSAAALIGLVATALSRLWRIPSIAIISAGIVPLVPGLSLYNGLMGVVQYAPTQVEFLLAAGTLTKAVMIGLAVATGASLGNMLGRPLRRRVRRWWRRMTQPAASQ